MLDQLMMARTVEAEGMHYKSKCVVVCFGLQMAVVSSSFLLVLYSAIKFCSVIMPLRDNQYLINNSTLKVLKSRVSHMLVA